MSETDALRGRLVLALAELCAERGYEETAPEAIAARAGVPLASFEATFPGGKEQCAIAAEDFLLTTLVVTVGRSYSADHSEWDSVLRGIKAILELMAASPAFIYFGHIVARQMAPPSVLKTHQSGRQLVEAMLERGQTYADSAHPPPRAAMGALGGADAAVRREVAAGRTQDLLRLLPDFVYAATVPFLGQRRALQLARQGREMIEAEEAGGAGDDP